MLCRPQRQSFFYISLDINEKKRTFAPEFKQAPCGIT